MSYGIIVYNLNDSKAIKHAIVGCDVDDDSLVSYCEELTTKAALSQVDGYCWFDDVDIWIEDNYGYKIFKLESYKDEQGFNYLSLVDAEMFYEEVDV